MTKSQLVSVIAKKAHLTRKATEEAIDALIEEITRNLKKGEKIVLSGFGTFSVGKVNDKAVEPFGNKDKRMTIKAHKIVNFKPGKPLKKAVW